MITPLDIALSMATERKRLFVLTRLSPGANLYPWVLVGPMHTYRRGGRNMSKRSVPVLPEESLE